MLVLKGRQFDPTIEDHALIKDQIVGLRTVDDVLVVDWTKSPLTPQEIIRTYLPIVEFAHELAYRVELKVPLVLMTRFSYDADPIVFCGHTLNPFAFEDVEVILDKK